MNEINEQNLNCLLSDQNGNANISISCVGGEELLVSLLHIGDDATIAILPRHLPLPSKFCGHIVICGNTFEY